jgi:dTMP kinase
MDTQILKKFIVIEGLDGAGTTTQLEMLALKFKEENTPFFKTAEPTNGTIGKIIRDVLKKQIIFNSKTLALLFSADRNEHLFGINGIIEHIKNNSWVISDRYLFSSIAYQSLSCDKKWIVEINKFPLPEYLFFIDVPPEICQKRMETRYSKELFEDIKLQKKILANYIYGIKKFEKKGIKINYIDGTKEVNIVTENIWNIIKKYR